MGVAGYRAVLRRTGTPTGFSAEGMTFESLSTAGLQTWRITDTSKNIWDRTVTPTFTASTAGSAVPSNQISDVNYLFGKVVFNTTQPAPVQATGTFLPASNVAGANTYTLTQNAEILDDTDFSSTGFRSKNLGLYDVNLTVSRWDNVDLEFVQDLIGTSTRGPGVPIVMEVQPGGSTNPQARGFFVVEAENRSADVASLEAADVTLQVDGSPEGAFRWSDQ